MLDLVVVVVMVVMVLMVVMVMVVVAHRPAQHSPSSVLGQSRDTIGQSASPQTVLRGWINVIPTAMSAGCHKIINYLGC